MIDSIIVLAQAGKVVDVSSAEIVLVGFSFVILVLALLALITAAMGSLFNKQSIRVANRTTKAAAVAAPVVTESSPVVAPSDSTNPDSPVVAAVIAAAVHMVMGDRPHRVVSIRSSGPGWAQEGRRQIFSSHRVR